MRVKNVFFQITTLVLAVALAGFSWPKAQTGQFPEISYAAVQHMVHYATPQELANIIGANNSGSILTDQEIPYAIPEDVFIYNSVADANNTYKKIPIFQDLNGDGLVDIIYSAERVLGVSTVNEKYVLINNGHGFDVVYYCKHGNGGIFGTCTK